MAVFYFVKVPASLYARFLFVFSVNAPFTSANLHSLFVKFKMLRTICI